MVQRGHHFAIVDEVDSILIDEARTPLIISGPAAESAQLYYQFAGIVRTLRVEDDYEVDEEKRIVVPTEAGIEKVERQLGVSNLYDAVAVNYVHHLTRRSCKELYRRDRTIWWPRASQDRRRVHRSTLDGRRWSDGLHQAVEAKERVRIKEENHTWATVTLQNYFRLYEKLSGMTGTAETEASSSPTPTSCRSSHPAQQAADPRGQPGSHLQDGGRQVQRRGRRPRRAPGHRPARAGRTRRCPSRTPVRLLEKKGIAHEC